MKNLLSFRRGVFGLAVAGLAATAIVSGAGAAFNFETSGDTISQDRALERFTKIRIKGALELKLVAGKDQKVTVTTEESHMKNVETYVRGDTLVIDMSDRERRSFWDDVDVNMTIHMQSFEGIEVMGAVDADIQGVESDQLDIDIKGAADIDIEGHCGTLDLEVNGAGDVSARNLECEIAEVDIRGAGNASVYASKSVDADVAGVANISIYGQPKTVRKNVGGLGSINIK